MIARLLVLTSLLSAIAFALFAQIVWVPALNKWERDNGYPYGRMCNSVFTRYVDTCPR